MKLVCFPNYTGGALVCDLLNNKTSPFRGSVIASIDHSVFKIGDKGFGVLRECDQAIWSTKVNKFKDFTSWFGTHCHPSIIKLNDFDEIISITTESEQSKWYRFLRAYYIYFEGHINNIEMLDGLIERIFDEFESHPECKNIEFEDIVNGKFVEEYNLNIEHFNEWKGLNSWLYSESDPLLVKHFNKRLKKGKRNAIQKPN